MRNNCISCEYEHPSQRRHSCLFEPEAFYFQYSFDNQVSKIKTPWLSANFSEALTVFGQKPNPVHVLGAVETLVSELKDEPYIREKLFEIKGLELNSFSNKVVDDVWQDFWEISGAMQENLWFATLYRYVNYHRLTVLWVF